MIILLTGKPGVGKSTALKKFIALYSQPSHWVITSRIPNPAGDGGLGFIATNSRGQTQIVSHKRDVVSNIVVGRNHVDVAAVEKMFLPILQDAIAHIEALAIIDEIGPIEMASAPFASLLPEVLSPKNDLVATMHLTEERLERYRQSPANVLLPVTLENRDIFPQALLTMVRHRQEFNRLDEVQQTAAITLIEDYMAEGQLLPIEKLMKNAIYYVNQGLISHGATRWVVKGRHGDYAVALRGDSYSCTCDLFNGIGKYSECAGECSHIQAVKIFTAKRG